MMNGMDDKFDNAQKTGKTVARHNEPQHNLNVKQAENVDDCKYRSHSGMNWRRLGRFFATMMVASLVLNELWEMAQMSAYVETAGFSWASSFGFCTRAALGDVGIILGIYAVGALAAGDPSWGLSGRWNMYATATVLGLVYATLVEHAALGTGRWSYAERMPVVSGFDAGLWPLLQMTLLPPLIFLFARWWACRSSTKGAL
jgi:hypothetical protein